MRIQIRLAALSVLLPLTAGLVGCDTEEGRADAEVRRMLAEAEKANQPGRIPALTKAADYAGQSSASKVHAKDLVGDEELAAARADAAQADTYAATAGQIVSSINRMTADIAEATRLSGNLQKLEPIAAREAVAKNIKAINEGEQGEWIAPLASLSATKATIDDLSKKIADAEAKIKALTEQQQAAAAEAARLENESAAAKGQTSVDLYKQASAKRKESADLTTQIDAANVALVPLKQDLALAQEQEQLRTAAAARFEAQGKTVDEGWTNVQTAKEGLAANAKTLVDGDVKTTAGSLAAATKDLAAALDEYQKLVTSATEHYELAQAHYGAAASEAQKYAGELAKLIGEKPDAPEVTAYKADQNTFTPARFNLKKGLALQGQAILLARQAELMTAQANAVAALGPVLQAAGQPMPAGLTAVDAKEAVAKANAAFDAATEALGTVGQAGGSTPSARDAKAAANVALMLTEYIRAQFATATGDATAARNHLAAAIAARDAALAEPNAQLPTGLPADLAPARAPTAPGAAPTTAPTASAAW